MGHLVVIFPGSLGDLVCFFPALKKIVAGEEEVTIVARKSTMDVLDAFQWLDPAVGLETVSLDEARFAKLFVQEEDGDGAVDLERFFKSATQVLSWSGHSSPAVRKNLARYVAGEFSVFPFFSGHVAMHACVYYLRCIGAENETTKVASDGDWAFEPFWLPVKRKWRLYGESFWTRKGWGDKKILIIHPGSGGQHKRWASEGFEAVAEWWTNECDREVLIVLGPAEEREEEHWSHFGQVEVSLEIAQVVSLLRLAECYLGNDSGVSHLAGVINLKGVVVFGPTSPEQWRPIGGRIVNLKNGAYRALNPEKPYISIDEVDPKWVLEALHGFRDK